MYELDTCYEFELAANKRACYLTHVAVEGQTRPQGIDVVVRAQLVGVWVRRTSKARTLQQQQPPSKIPQVESREGRAYADLTPTRRSRETVSGRPSAQKDEQRQ